MKILILILVVVEYSFCFEKLRENIQKIHEHRDEELLKYTGDEYMIQVIY